LLKGRTNGNVICLCTWHPDTPYDIYTVACKVCKANKLLDEPAQCVADDAGIERLAEAILGFAKDHMHDPTIEEKTERKFR
jgi:hypothetical protein